MHILAILLIIVSLYCGLTSFLLLRQIKQNKNQQEIIKTQSGDLTEDHLQIGRHFKMLKSRERRIEILVNMNTSLRDEYTELQEEYARLEQGRQETEEAYEMQLLDQYEIADRLMKEKEAMAEVFHHHNANCLLDLEETVTMAEAELEDRDPSDEQFTVEDGAPIYESVREDLGT